jgi:membrane-associated protease RseP (regulator of RpoE activity)
MGFPVTVSKFRGLISALRFKRTPIWVYILMFGISFFTCTIAGTQWANQNILVPSNWQYGIQYAVLILLFLSAHEFGHYFAARYHKVDTTLPFYIPFPFPILINFGTLGAVIRTRTPIPSSKALFDIGVAGPVAGFVVSIIFLAIGFATLPTIDFIYKIHPEYLIHFSGEIPKVGLHFGETILYNFFANVFANPAGFVPPMNEIYHYPLLNVGWFGLFVTTLNMLPIGQLDGGHISYSMFGKNHRKIARFVWWILVAIGVFALLGELYNIIRVPVNNQFILWMHIYVFPILKLIKTNVPFLMDGWAGWLVWALITRFLIKLDHPPVSNVEPLDIKRKALGWISFIILILSFSYQGVYFLE